LFSSRLLRYFFFQAEDGIRDTSVTGVQTCALPISVYLRGKISNTRKERWILDSSGKPKSLEIEFIQYERVTKRNGNQKSYHKVIPVNSDGTTERIPEISFPSKSFYTQKRKFEFISPYILQDFRGDKIVERTEDITIETFDIKDPNYFQSYIFYYNEKEQ